MNNIVADWIEYLHGYYRREGRYLTFTQEGQALRLPEAFNYKLEDSQITKTYKGFSGKVAVVGWETNIIISEETNMSKFKVGQKVYCIRRGLGEIYQRDQYFAGGRFFLVKFPEKDNCEFTFDGKLYDSDLNPTLLTLEEARAKGYDVPKQKIVKEKTVYINLYEDYIFGKFSKEEMTREYNQNAILNSYPVTIKYEIEE